MCTAACFKDKDCYFGRNLDYEFSYGEQIVVTPRNFEYGFRYTDEPSYKYAIIGMAHVSDGYPLYYDAMNEKGLGMAGLNFVGNAYFNPVVVLSSLFLGSYVNVKLLRKRFILLMK